MQKKYAPKINGMALVTYPRETTLKAVILTNVLKSDIFRKLYGSIYPIL